MSFTKVCTENSDKDLHTALQLIFNKMQLCQHILASSYMGENTLRTVVIWEYQGIPSLEIALFRLAKTCEELFVNLCSLIQISLSCATSVYLQDNVISTYYQDI